MKTRDAIAISSGRPPKTLDELFRRFQGAPENRSAGVSIRRQRARVFERALERFGALTLAEIADRGTFRGRLYSWRDTFADRPSEGGNTIRIICTVFNFAVDRGWLMDNPAAGMRPLSKHFGKGHSRADKIWTFEQLRALRAAAPDWVRDVIDVATWTGLRECDIIHLTSERFADGWLRTRPSKTLCSTGVVVELPYYLLPPLAETFNRILAYPWRADAPILRNRIGSKWNDRELRRWFAKAKQVAGFGPLDLHFHDLRGTLITWLLEAGCTEAEVGAISGHALARGNIRSYSARSRTLAENAYTKLAQYIEGKW